MSNQTFKKGDNVFHAAYGWGKVMGIYEELECPVEVEFYNWGCETFTDDGRTMPGYPMVLSFTEYTLEGFSLERPEEMPTKGDIVWVREYGASDWRVSHFFGKVGDKYLASIFGIEEFASTWPQMTTKNPHANEK